jgi:peptidoglycan hydrolase-like protein with peptidoglycan-binding domain
MIALFKLGLNVDQASSIAANTMSETAWGRLYRAWNLGGWKITKDTAFNSDRSPRKWYRAAGNKSSGDPPTCFYRAFNSIEHFFDAWLKQFVPKNASDKHRYKKTAEAFWANKDWYPELIQAGYKGAVTRANPTKSIQSHKKLIEGVLTYWAQHCLGVTVDGKWGPKSTAACVVFQKANDFNPTGVPDRATILALSNNK